MTPPGPSTSPVVYISDPSTIARTFLPDPVRETDLRSWVDMVADGGIDIFGQEVFSQGWTAYWSTASATKSTPTNTTNVLSTADFANSSTPVRSRSKSSSTRRITAACGSSPASG